MIPSDTKLENNWEPPLTNLEHYRRERDSIDWSREKMGSWPHLKHLGLRQVWKHEKKEGFMVFGVSFK